MQQRLRTHRSTAATLKAELQRAAISLPRSSACAHASLDEAGAEESAAQRARLLATGERLRSGTSALQAAHASVLETEQIGSSILDDLSQQRETLMHSLGTVRGAAEKLSRSRRLLVSRHSKNTCMV